MVCELLNVLSGSNAKAGRRLVYIFSTYWTSSRQAVRACRLRLALLFICLTGLAFLPGQGVLSYAQTPAQAGGDTDPAVSNRNPRPLEPGRPVERELAGGQAHSYQITLPGGQYIHVVADQRGIDVVVTLYRPDGGKLIEVDSPNGADGPELLTWITETSGTYRLEVRSLRMNSPAGRYELRIEESRRARPEDRALLKALVEADKLDKESDRLFFNLGKQGDAIQMAERALAIREKALGPDHLDVAASLYRLGLFYDNRGDYARAEPLYGRALAIREKALGPDHPIIVPLLNSLASLYRAEGDYAKPEPLLRRALAISENKLGSEHPQVAVSLRSLAVLYQLRGDYTRAEPLYQRALAIWERTLGTDHPNVRFFAQTLNSLGRLYEIRGDYSKAEQLYQRALAIQEKEFGPEHADVAESLYELGALYHHKSDYKKAEPLYQRALSIVEKKLGPDDWRVSIPLSYLGALYKDKGDYGKAEPLLQRALINLEKTFGPDHPQVATALDYLMTLYVAIGDSQRAIASATRAAELSESTLRRTLLIGSERQKLLYLRRFDAETNAILSLHLRSAPDSPQALRLALTTLLRRKGRGLEAATDVVARLRRLMNPADQALLDKLADTRSQLAALTLTGPGRTGPDQFKIQLTQLESEADKLEARLSAISAGFRAQSVPVTTEAIQEAIPEGAALVEFALYRSFDAKTIQRGPSNYVAYVIGPRGEPRWVELGEAAAIDRAVDLFRRALRDRKQTDVKRQARKVDELVMKPIRPLLGAAKRVLISPEGVLNLIPFAALVDEQDRYLVERYEFSYLTSGRDLLRLQSPPRSRGGPLVIADPAFGEKGSTHQQAARLLTQQPGEKSGIGQLDFTKLFFSPLPGTAAEAKVLKTILPQARVLTGAGATKSALKEAAAPSILHIATHGFFLEDAEPPSEPAGGLGLLDNSQPATDATNSKWSTQITNPLLRSGLGLAGANLHKGGTEDGVLTALEVAGLDLWGTRLVVLSACDSGVGEVKNGEGVYGLRRALVLAGSETQVMSLWPVSDQGTRDLMIGYYKGLVAGRGRSEALRQVQLKMLTDPKRNHPYYWASFIQSGEWANLDGRR